MPKDKVYDVKLFGLGLNLIEGFTENYNANIARLRYLALTLFHLFSLEVRKV